MITANYSITFDFAGDNGKLKVNLVADVEVHHSRPFYVVRNFHVPGRPGSSLLPEIKLRKAKGEWVHADSGRASDLSASVGMAINAYERSQHREEAG